MRLLLDTNVLIDYYARREPFVHDTYRLRIAQAYGDVELWACSQSLTDVLYILRHAIDADRLRQMMLGSLDFLHIAAPSAADFTVALQDGWPDVEDRIIALCAERVKADHILTRDVEGFVRSSVPASAPADFLGQLEAEREVAYDEVAL